MTKTPNAICCVCSTPHYKNSRQIAKSKNFYCSTKCYTVSRIKICTNQKIGALIVSKYIGIKDGQGTWLCKCDCGTIREYTTKDLAKVTSCGCRIHMRKMQRARHHEQHTNKRFGNLVAVKVAGFKNQRQIYECICDCGNIVNLSGNVLQSGHAKTCGKCVYNKKLRKNARYLGNEILSQRQFGSCKSNADARNIYFDISLGDIKIVFDKQDGKCCYSGEPLVFRPDSKSYNKYMFASIDRIDSNRPYIIDNIQLCIGIYNLMKWEFSDNKFYSYIKQVVEYQDGLFIPTKRIVDTDINYGNNYKGYKLVGSSIISRIRGNCKKSSKYNTYDVDCKYIWKIYEKQRYVCKLSGLPIDFNIHVNEKAKQTASIDRIDSSKGYIKRNIQIVHRDINRMKLELSNKDFINYCRKIYDYKNLSNGDGT